MLIVKSKTLKNHFLKEIVLDKRMGYCAVLIKDLNEAMKFEDENQIEKYFTTNNYSLDGYFIEEFPKTEL